MLETLLRLGSIAVVDLVLSGDNALVIGMAAHRLPPRQRRWAIVLGGVGAIGLRVLFTALAALLLVIPLLGAIGGLLIYWIGYKLVQDEGSERPIDPAGSLWEAIQTITLADFVMSFDNMLAVGGAAHGSVPSLTFGLLLSMPLILFGSRLVAALLDRVPWLLWVGVVVLIVTGTRLIAEDPWIEEHLGRAVVLPLATGLAIVATVATLAGRVRRRRQVEDEE